jgi:WD40 repeat protein
MLRDSKLRVWNLNYLLNHDISISTSVKFQSNLVFTQQLHDCLLSVCWQGESANLFTGCGDGSIYFIDLITNTNQIIGKYEIGCKELIWLPNMNILMSGGWDGKLSFWDLRDRNPCFQLNLGRKMYTISLVFPLLVVGMSDRIVSYFNLNKLLAPSFGAEATFE